MREIPLTQGKIALVDDCDYEELSKYKWCLSKTKEWVYAARGEYPNGKHPNRKQRTILMHRQILEVLDPRIQVDHRNRNGLDNRRENIRVCTSSENNRNKRKQHGTSSRFKGVCWHKKAAKWMARIDILCKQHHLGLFVDEEQAARTYDEAAIQHFGEFACLNFPLDTP